MAQSTSDKVVISREALSVKEMNLKDQLYGQKIPEVTTQKYVQSRVPSYTLTTPNIVNVMGL
jgi:hypothetical protein